MTKPKTIIMKLLFLIILLCGITSTPSYTAKATNACDSRPKTTTANIDMLPSGLIFQF
jgi:hypothetical protein